MTKPADATRSIVIKREMPHPPEKVWRALTQPHLIAEWLMKNDFAPMAGHRFRFTADWGSVDCQVLEVEPNQTLTYTWDHKSEDPAFNLKSVVTFTLTPTPEGTRLRVEQAGFRPEHRQAFGGAQAGWRQMLGKLEEVLSRSDD